MFYPIRNKISITFFIGYFQPANGNINLTIHYNTPLCFMGMFWNYSFFSKFKENQLIV